MQKKLQKLQKKSADFFRKKVRSCIATATLPLPCWVKLSTWAFPEWVELGQILSIQWFYLKSFACQPCDYSDPCRFSFHRNLLPSEGFSRLPRWKTCLRWLGQGVPRVPPHTVFNGKAGSPTVRPCHGNLPNGQVSYGVVCLLSVGGKGPPSGICWTPTSRYTLSICQTFEISLHKNLANLSYTVFLRAGPAPSRYDLLSQVCCTPPS